MNSTLSILQRFRAEDPHFNLLIPCCSYSYPSRRLPVRGKPEVCTTTSNPDGHHYHCHRYSRQNLRRWWTEPWGPCDFFWCWVPYCCIDCPKDPWWVHQSYVHKEGEESWQSMTCSLPWWEYRRGNKREHMQRTCSLENQTTSPFQFPRVLLWLPFCYSKTYQIPLSNCSPRNSTWYLAELMIKLSC